jgi:DNA polymerase-1
MLVSRESFKQVIERLLTFSEYGTDCETTGLKFTDRLFAITIAVSENEVYYFNFNHKQPEAEPLPYDMVRELQPLFRQGATHYISNAKFDMRMLRHAGLEMRGKFFCTAAQGRVLRNNLLGKAYGLKATALRYGFPEKIDAVEQYIAANRLSRDVAIPGKLKLHKEKDFWKVPLAVMQPYAEHDAVLHLLVGKKILEEIVQLKNPVGEQPQKVAVNELLLTKVCHDMEWEGIKIDKAYIRKAQAFEEERAAEYRREYKEITGTDFKNSGPMLEEAFRAQGVTEFPSVTKGGKPSFDDSALEKLSGPLAECVRRIRHHDKRIATYYSSFLYYADAFDRIHANVNQGSTETGRFSYSDPNLQQVPKEEAPKDGEINPWYTPESIVRKSFIPNKGKCFVAIDFSQQEYRIMLAYSGEKEIIRQVMEGADVHQAMADMIGVKRSVAKTLNFAVLYGAGAEKVAATLNITVPDSRKLIDLYYAKLPNVRRFKEDVIRKGRARGYICNWAGRQLHIANRDWAYILPNHLCQSGGADVIKFAMPQIHMLLKKTKSRMAVQIHDEILFEFHPDDFDLIPQIREIMETVFPPLNGMRLTTSIEHSWVSWGSVDQIEGSPK